jgi:Flp pilus assembly protein TadG
VLTHRSAPPERDERGTVAVIAAVAMLAVLLVTAIVVDVALARLNRQMNKSTADQAVMAGLQGLDAAATDIYTERGVCTALAYLKANEPALAGLSDGPCTPTMVASSAVTCDKTNPAAALTEYNGSIVSDGVTYKVLIKSPYLTSEGGFSDEAYATLASDLSKMNGCDQLGVVISQSRPSLFGDLATSGELSTTIRSVGRVAIGDGEQAPALILLERSKCNVLSVGSAGAGSGSHIRVYGTATTPGSIHADTNASDTSGTCGTSSGKQVFQGKQENGLVAFGSTSGLPGRISSLAGNLGVAAAIVSDGLANVYGTTALNESGTGTKSAPDGRGLVTRKPIDDRYIAGVRSAIGTAQPTTFTRTITNCNPTAAQLDTLRNSLATTPLTSADSVRFACTTGDRGLVMGDQTNPLVIGAGTVVIDGWVKGGGLHMPNATRVYVNEKASSGTAISLSSGNAFCMRSTSCAAAPVNQCSTTPSLGNSNAKLFVRRGTLDQSNGSIMRLCNTTVYLLGGDATAGCVPTTSGTAPTSTPCPGPGAGDGQLKINGGATDWTAPNRYDVIPDPDQVAAWTAGEDLALWAESAGSYSMAGGGSMQLVGVLMAPNATPFELTGGGSQSLANAQYIARTFSLAGGATLSMTVDPNSAVTVPELDPFTLVR